MLSWFGAVRMKRKPLKYEEQRWMVQFHSHQDQFQGMIYNPHYVSLPEVAAPAPNVVEDGVKNEEDGTTTDVPKENFGQTSSTSIAIPTPSTSSVSAPGVDVTSQQAAANQVQVSGAARPPMSATMPSQAAQQGQFTLNPGMGPRAPVSHMMSAGRGMGRGMMGGGGMPMNRMPVGGAGVPLSNRLKLEQIRAANLQQQHVRTGVGVQYQPAPGGVMMTNPYRPPMSAMNPAGMGGHDASQLNMQQQIMYQRHQQMQQRRFMAAKLQQQQMQRQRAAMMQAAGYPQQQQYGMRPTPMQANPPMPMQQVMQQPQYVQQTPGTMMMRAPRPHGQPMAYQPGMNPTMPQQPPMYR